jgi:hypothetical protein
MTPFVTRLLNVELQDLLFGHDEFLFCKVDGLHYKINSIGISSHLLFLMRSAHE